MPFRSEKQRRYLWATHPDIAKEWADKYPKSNKGLPMYASDAKKEKAAGIDISSLISPYLAPYVNTRTLLNNSILHEEPAETAKNAADKLIKVDIPHSDKPTYAGEEREEGETKTENNDEPQNGGIERRDPENAINSLLQKISVVLSQPMAQMLENRKAQQEGRNPAYQPKNPGISRYSAPTPSIPMPMGMQQPAPQAQPQAQPAKPQPQQQQGAGMNSPSANPINSFGPISSSGNINGNAAFGVKNSPDSLKTALDKWAFSLPFGSNSKKKRRIEDEEPAILKYPRRGNSNALAGGVAAGAAALPLISLHQDAFGTYNTLRERVRGVPVDHMYFPKEMAESGKVMHGDVGTYFGEPQHLFHNKQPNTSKLTQGGEWTSGSGTYHGMLLRPFMNKGKQDVQLLEGGDAFPDKVPVTADGTRFDSPFHRFMAEQARTGKLPQETADAYLAAEGTPKFDQHLQDFEHTTSKGLFNRYYNAFTNATSKNQTGDAAEMKFFPRFQHYLRHYKTQGKLLDEYRKQMKPEDAAAVWDNMSERDGHPMLVTRSPQMQLLMDSKHPGVADQARANVDTAFEKHYPMRSYNLGGAVSAGAKRLLLPKTSPTDQTIMADNDSLSPLPKPVCNEDYCVQPAANVLKHHGVPLGTHATTALPADLATTGASRPVGMIIPTPDLAKDDAKAYGFLPPEGQPDSRDPDYNNPANKPLLDKWKQDYQNKIVNDWMPQSRNRRIMAGLAAAAAMGAAGYGTTKLVQSILKRRRKALAAKKRQEARAQLNTAKAAAYQHSELPAFLLEYVQKVSREYPEGQAHD